MRYNNDGGEQTDAATKTGNLHHLHWIKLLNEHITFFMLVQKVKFCHAKF